MGEIPGLPPVPPRRPAPLARPAAEPGAASAPAPAPAAPPAPTGDVAQVSGAGAAMVGGLGVTPIPGAGEAFRELDRAAAALEASLDKAWSGSAATGAALSTYIRIAGTRRPTLGDDLLEMAPPGSLAAERLIEGAGRHLGELPADTLEQLYDGLPPGSPLGRQVLAAYDQARSREERAA